MTKFRALASGDSVRFLVPGPGEPIIGSGVIDSIIEEPFGRVYAVAVTSPSEFFGAVMAVTPDEIARVSALMRAEEAGR